MDSPWAPGDAHTLRHVHTGEVTVTLKQSGKYDAAWIVIKDGTAAGAKRLLCETFGHDPLSPSVEGFTLAELTAAFSESFQGVHNVQKVLGGRVVNKASKTKAGEGSLPKREEPDPGDVWADKPTKVLGVRGLIAESPSLKHLSDVIWRQYYDTIQGDADLMAFYMDRGKALKAAEKAAAEEGTQGSLV